MRSLFFVCVCLLLAGCGVAKLPNDSLEMSHCLAEASAINWSNHDANLLCGTLVMTRQYDRSKP